MGVIELLCSVHRGSRVVGYEISVDERKVAVEGDDFSGLEKHLGVGIYQLERRTESPKEDALESYLESRNELPLWRKCLRYWKANRG